jgi:hypothetical protein
MLYGSPLDVVDSFVQDTVCRLNTGLRSATKQWRGDYVEVEVRYGGVKDDARQVCTLSLQCV